MNDCVCDLEIQVLEWTEGAVWKWVVILWDFDPPPLVLICSLSLLPYGCSGSYSVGVLSKDKSLSLPYCLRENNFFCLASKYVEVWIVRTSPR